MRLLALASALCLALIASAPAQSNSGIEIIHPWARATAGTAANGAVYLKIVDHGAGEDRLTAPSRPRRSCTPRSTTMA